MERLDRGFCNKDWGRLFPQFVIQHLEFWGSDHRPLVLDVTDGQRQRATCRRFYFEECWIEDNDCTSIVNAAWKDSGYRDQSESVLSKIDRCGRMLSSWNIKKRRDHRQDLHNKKEALKQACQVNVPVSWKEIRSLETQLDEALVTEERYWSQRANVDWLKNGDRNTWFFHSKASTRKARNRINGLFD
ncbi:hypothetical protein Dsin_002648 [Dipteronia sinensis]|uniref:Uncharacterized protein n=1 Tax=Dipteronia sinensis TaxID=43782 RepID=A0AAE0EK63_9ROSI|nr:hypothetical protein Dsin_002648 [Dipteronia sinensis]